MLSDQVMDIYQPLIYISGLNLQYTLFQILSRCLYFLTLHIQILHRHLWEEKKISEGIK